MVDNIKSNRDDVLKAADALDRWFESQELSSAEPDVVMVICTVKRLLAHSTKIADVMAHISWFNTMMSIEAAMQLKDSWKL